MLRTRDAQNGPTIDRKGNRWTQYVNGNTSPGNLVVPSTNQISSTSGVAYDAMGNVSQWNNSVTNHTYVYDAEGRMVSVDSNAIQYIYDAFGRRVEKIVNNALRDEYLYDLGGNVVADVNGTSGVWIRGEIWAGRHLATYAGGTSGTTYFAHQDWLGSERVRTDVNGNVAQSCTDRPYGDGLACSGPAGTSPTAISPYNFAGMEYDGTVAQGGTGLYHTPFRFYNPVLGSWMTPDPGGLGVADLNNPQSFNRYAYVLNNPMNFLDPLGLGCQNVTVYNISDDGTSSLSSETTCTPGSGGPGGGSGCAQSAFAPLQNGTGDVGTDCGGQQPPTQPPTFNQCMAANSSTFSVAGLAQGLVNGALSGLGSSVKVDFKDTWWAQLLGGNSISGLYNMVASGSDDSTAVTSAPELVERGMGTVITYGRRSSTIEALNLAGKGGLPQALSSASAGIKSMLGGLNDVLNLGMSAGTRLLVDGALAAAEAAYCAATTQ